MVGLTVPPHDIHKYRRRLGVSSKQADLLEVIATNPDDPIGIDNAFEMAEVKTRSNLKKLMDVGYVFVEKTNKDEQDLIFLSLPPESVDEVLLNLRRGETEWQLLQLLAQAKDTISKSELLKQTKATPAQFERLIEAQLIHVDDQRVYRDSLADRDFIPALPPKLTDEQTGVWQAVQKRVEAWVWKYPSLTLHEFWEGFESSDEGFKSLAKQVREQPSEAENHLWQRLKKKQVLGMQFRRQQRIERFLVDFYCPTAKLVIDVDGAIQQYTPDEAVFRQAFLESLGLQVMCFSQDEVLDDLEGVIQQIQGVLADVKLSQTDYAFLIHGVTGSGKTEIYLQAIEQTLAQGRQAIFLVPEIALTPQTIRRVAERFPEQVAVVHGSLSQRERFDTWQRARQGDIGVIVGTRSALFTPLPDVGLVILDEEHDPSYKQSPPFNAPHYHARDVAYEMMELNEGVLILGSATPDSATYYQAQQGRYQYLHLPNRIMGHRQRIVEQAEREGVTARYQPVTEDALMIDLPPVEVIDMRDELKAGNRSMFSESLQEALFTVLERGEQAMLYLNRRGQNTYVFCRDCGYVARCPRCDTPLTYHRYGQSLHCHHCDYTTQPPTQCPDCQSARIKFFGAGTQQVEDEIQKLFPEARTLRWDADTANKPELHDVILGQFIRHEADILIGTQMIAKGLDLPLVTLVGVVSADMGLALPDYRAGERVFQLLTQVAGRAGRGVLGGKVILQTYQPEHYAIRYATQHDYLGFIEQELVYRRDLGYPPYRRLARLVFQYRTEKQAQTEAQRATKQVRHRLKKYQLTGTELIGPAPCFFSRIDQQYRWHLLIRGPNPSVALDDLPLRPGWHLDLDPVSVL